MLTLSTGYHIFCTPCLVLAPPLYAPRLGQESNAAAPATSTRCSPEQAFSLISSFIDDGFSFSLSSDTGALPLPTEMELTEARIELLN